MINPIKLLEAIYFYLTTSYKIWRIKRIQEDDLVYVTNKDVKIAVYPGKKKQSLYDFIVKYQEPSKRERTPAHVHLIVEMYVKHAYNSSLTLKLRDHILEMFKNIKPIDYYPPKLQYYKKEHIEHFRKLDSVGEFSVEFMLVATEFMAIQEKTNYPKGSLTERLYEAFGEKDRFSVIQKAVWKN